MLRFHYKMELTRSGNSNYRLFYATRKRKFVFLGPLKINGNRRLLCQQICTCRPMSLKSKALGKTLWKTRIWLVITENIKIVWKCLPADAVSELGMEPSELTAGHAGPEYVGSDYVGLRLSHFPQKLPPLTEPEFLNTLNWQLGWKCEYKVSK